VEDAHSNSSNNPRHVSSGLTSSSFPSTTHRQQRSLHNNSHYTENNGRAEVSPHQKKEEKEISVILAESGCHEVEKEEVHQERDEERGGGARYGSGGSADGDLEMSDLL
jgi:hypothetical protein